MESSVFFFFFFVYLFIYFSARTIGYYAVPGRDGSFISMRKAKAHMGVRKAWPGKIKYLLTKALIRNRNSNRAFVARISDNDLFLRIDALINPFTPSGLFYHKSLDRSISNRRDVWLVFILKSFIEIYVINANGVALIRRHVLWRPSWVYTICQCPFYGTLGIHGLSWKWMELWENQHAQHKDKDYLEQLRVCAVRARSLTIEIHGPSMHLSGKTYSGGEVGGGEGGGGRWGREGVTWGNCGTGVRASISKPTPFMCLAFEKK